MNKATLFTCSILAFAAGCMPADAPKQIATIDSIQVSVERTPGAYDWRLTISDSAQLARVRSFVNGMTKGWRQPLFVPMPMSAVRADVAMPGSDGTLEIGRDFVIATRALSPDQVIRTLSTTEMATLLSLLGLPSGANLGTNRGSPN